MGRLVLVLAAVLLPTATFAQSLSGKYLVWGRKLDGDVYSGVAEVRDDGKAVTIFWDTTAGVYSGTGLREGNIVMIDTGADFLRYYRVMKDGELHGTWGDGFAIDRMVPQ